MYKHLTLPAGTLKNGDKVMIDGKVETIIEASTGNLGRHFEKSTVPNKIPETIGAAVDSLYSTRLLRLEVQKEVERLAKFESELKEHLIQTLPKSDSTGAAGKLARVTIVPKTVPTVEDWDKLYAYVRKTKDFSLLQKRLSGAAVEERWDAGKEVPGVGRFTIIGVSVNKL